MAVPSKPHVAVIGAGAAGVATAAHLIYEGLDVTVFERAHTSGGIWVFSPKIPLEPTYPSPKPSVGEVQFHNPAENDDPYILHSSPGPAYESLTNNVPTELLEMSFNPWKPGTESFVSHVAIREYLQESATRSGVTERTVFNTKVERLKKEHGKWNVTTTTWDNDKNKTTTKSWIFDAVVVATGHYHAPKVPDTPGLAEWKQAFPSRVQHSKKYRNPQGFENQTVLVIGGSSSSRDIVKDVAPIAKHVYQSTRGGAHDHDPSVLPENATRIGGILSFDPLQNNADRKSGPIPGTVTLVNGQILENIDRVVLATGYQFSLPFLADDFHRDDLLPEEADERVLITDGSQMHNLHKDIFYIPDPTLSFVGVPFYTATFSLFEFQAIAVAAYLSGESKLPSEDQMRSEYRKRVEEKGYGKGFHSLMGKSVEYAAELMQWVNDGREPSKKKVDGYSEVWLGHYQKLFKPGGLLSKTPKVEEPSARPLIATV